MLGAIDWVSLSSKSDANVPTLIFRSQPCFGNDIYTLVKKQFMLDSVKGSTSNLIELWIFMSLLASFLFPFEFTDLRR